MSEPAPQPQTTEQPINLEQMRDWLIGAIWHAKERGAEMATAGQIEHLPALISVDALDLQIMRALHSLIGKIEDRKDEIRAVLSSRPPAKPKRAYNGR